MLFPDQGLRQKTDHEYNWEREHMEKEIRREEFEVKRRTQEKGEDPEGDQPTTKDMGQVRSEKG